MNLLIKNLTFRLPSLVVTLALLAIASPAKAHFIWIYDDAGTVKLVFGEALEPDQHQFLSGLTALQAWSIREGQVAAIELDKQQQGDLGWFETPVEKIGQAIDVSCLYGVFERGDSSMLLEYHAKYVKLLPGEQVPATGKLKLDLIPRFDEGRLQLQVLFDGKPIEGVELSIDRVESGPLVITTQSDGRAVFAPACRYVIRAKHSIAESGEHEGSAYTEKRHYCTLVLDTHEIHETAAATVAPAALAAPTAPTASEGAGADVDQPASSGLANGGGTTAFKNWSSQNSPLADLPRGMTSFGATIADGRLFVIGGKEGKAHAYAKEYQNRSVFCLDLADWEQGVRHQWATIGDNLGLQGLAIVSHRGKIYRIGGLEAKNSEGEPDDLHSVADFVEFDPQTGQWSNRPQLPMSRSSFDACVHGSTIYVLGGWQLKGKEDAQWCNDLLFFDLSDPQAQWQRSEVPFQARALAVECFADKLYAIGGITPDDGPTQQVHVFDFKSQKWTAGPDVPSNSSMAAFGCSACVVGDQLLVSTYDGGLFRLAAAGNQWDQVGELEQGRFFHQMLPLDSDSLVIVGGAHMDVGRITKTITYRVDRADRAAPQEASSSDQ